MSQRMEVVGRVESKEVKEQWDQATSKFVPNTVGKRIAHVAGMGFNGAIECDVSFFESLKAGEIYRFPVDVDAQKTDNGAKLAIKCKYPPELQQRNVPQRNAA